MKRIIVSCSCILAVATAFAGNPVRVDSLNLKQLQEVQVISTRASNKAPMAFTNVRKAEIQDVNYGKDIPFILSLTPSALTTSDAGIGMGYTTLRVRGTDATRINVTANGIPMNDAESHGLFWVNMPDLASSIENIQIQRGVGTSTNGSGAFGASINMQTEGISDTPYLKFDVSGGSYGSHKETLRFGTGLLNEHWGFTGRLSNLGSDGYIDRASVKLNSYFLQGGYFDDNGSIKFITFNGTERTYHAWDYATKEDMQKYGRSYNPCGKYRDNEGNKTFYKDQTDNYHQQNYQLLWNRIITNELNFNLALHYTHGYGYYEQYKTDQKLYKYAIAGQTDSVSDLVRQKILDNDFYGTVFSVNYLKEKVRATIGGGWNKYDGDHIGKVTWVRKSNGLLTPEHPYYTNRAHKQDFNIYGKVNYEFIPGLNGYADLQYRYIDYRMHGPSDQYSGRTQINYDVKANFSFLNPKVGLHYDIDGKNTVYASYALAQKEPTRNDYEDNLTSSPKAEKLNDFELGYQFHSGNFSAGLNFYYMLYNNQFVLTGEQNAIGEMIARNVGKSYRRGVELTAAWKPFSFLEWNGNATWSHNRSKDLKFWVDDTNEYYNTKSTPLSFSPDLTVSSVVKANYRGFTASLQSQFVGEQYMTNTGLRSYQGSNGKTSLMLDRFFVSNLDLSYTFNQLKFVKSLTLGCTVYNLFGDKYESFGSAYTAIKSNGQGGIMGYDDGWNSYSVYSAQAPTHFMVHLSVGF